VSAEPKAPTKVFISYSWDSEEHKERVLQLANTLRTTVGIDADLDQYVRAVAPFTPQQGWENWMQEKIKCSEFVLIVCTETYTKRFEGNEEPGKGLGVSWEGTIIQQSLYQSQRNDTKFIPVVFTESDAQHIPSILSSKDRYNLNDEKSYTELCYRLRGQALIEKPAIKNLPLPPVSLNNSPTEKPEIGISLHPDLLDDEYYQKVIELIKKKTRYTDPVKYASGSLTTVYKASDPPLNRWVAIKVLDRKDLKDAFKDSIGRALRISDEPYFITIYDYVFDEEEEFYCYIMQFIEGKSLRTKILEEYSEGFNIEIAWKLFMKIGTALVRSWSLNSCDGNIKPSNIMLGESPAGDDLEPFISPFNLRRSLSPKVMLEELERMSETLDRQAAEIKARENSEAKDLELERKKLKKQELEYLEALAYLVPERFNNEEYAFKLSQRTDEYILGLVIYEILTGEIPPVFDSLKDTNKNYENLSKNLENLKRNRHKALATLQQDKHRAFRRLPSITERRPRSKCPNVYETIVAKMTSLDPDDRYKTLEEVIGNFLIYRNIDLNIAKDSYARCARQPNFSEDFFRTFYKRFTGEGSCPHAKTKFSPDWTDKDWKRQHQLLKEAILLLFSYFEHRDEPEELNILTRIAEIHSRRGRDVPVDFYEPFINALIETVVEFDPRCKGNDDIQERIKRVWRDVTKPGIDYMKRKY